MLGTTVYWSYRISSFLRTHAIFGKVKNSVAGRRGSNMKSWHTELAGYVLVGTLKYIDLYRRAWR